MFIINLRAILTFYWHLEMRKKMRNEKKSKECMRKHTGWKKIVVVVLK